MRKLSQAKQIYQNIQIPDRLETVVREAFEEPEEPAHGKIRWYQPVLCSLASLCVLFVVLLNSSQVFAASLENIPVLGSIARVFTFRQYQEEDTTKLISVREPAISDTGNPELEGRINREIREKVDAAIEDAERQAKERYQAFVETGGKEDEFIPVDIAIDYDIKNSSGNILSFVLTRTEIQANAYTEHFFYNLNLETGENITLKDLLGDNYIAIVDREVDRQIAERKKNSDAMFFEDELAFSGITESQRFYINEKGNPVICFEKYEIAPGYMGEQEFEIIK